MAKKTLVYVTGSVNSPFFFNEIKELREAFPEFIVIQINDNTKNAEVIEREYGIKIYSINKARILVHPMKLFKWRFAKSTRNEITNNVKGIKSIKRLAYVYLYGITAILIEQIIDKIRLSSNDIYLYSFWLSRGAYAVARCKGKQGIKKIIARAHRYDLYECQNSMNYLPFRSYINDYLDYILFISNHGKRYFIDRVKDKKETSSKKKVLHLGTRYGRGGEWHKNSNRIVIASCSMINEVKRLDLIIDFLSLAEFNIANIKWIHIGAGTLAKDIKKYAREKLKIRYKFYDEVDNFRILDIYIKENVDFFINMSDSEGMPVSIMEAMSCGIPVIARPVGGIPEMVKNNINGFLFENDDLSQMGMKIMAEKIITLKTSKQWNYYSKNSFNGWLANFNAKENTKSLIEILLQKERNKG